MDNRERLPVATWDDASVGDYVCVVRGFDERRGEIIMIDPDWHSLRNARGDERMGYANSDWRIVEKRPAAGGLEDAVGTFGKLPTFANLQEGDWVGVRRERDPKEYFHGHVRRVEPAGPGSNGWLYTDRNSLETFDLTIIAFKPLRQVVEHLALTYDPSDKLGCEDMGASGYMVATDHFDMTLSDERTALLAAKAALEVMIARKGKP